MRKPALHANNKDNESVILFGKIHQIGKIKTIFVLGTTPLFIRR